MKKQGFRSVEFSRSRRKIIRAGLANILVPIAAAFCMMMYLVMRDIKLSSYIIFLSEMLLFFVFVFYYTRAVSQIKRRGDVLIFECSLHEINIPIKNIKKARIIILRPYFQILFIIIEKENFFPHVFVASKIAWDIECMKLAKEEVIELINDSGNTGDTASNS